MYVRIGANPVLPFLAREVPLCLKADLQSDA